MNWSAVIDKLRDDALYLAIRSDEMDGVATTVRTLKSIADALEAGQSQMSKSKRKIK